MFRRATVSANPTPITTISREMFGIIGAGGGVEEGCAWGTKSPLCPFPPLPAANAADSQPVDRILLARHSVPFWSHPALVTLLITFYDHLAPLPTPTSQSQHALAVVGKNQGIKVNTRAQH